MTKKQKQGLIAATIPTLSDQPRFVEWAGNLDLVLPLNHHKRPRIAVVGARDLSSAGKLLAEKTVQRICKKRSDPLLDPIIVSGLAAGADTIAHSVALDCGADTVAVLGTGLDRYYPKSNKFLQNKIRDHGALVSPFSANAGPSKTSFPLRNHLIVHMCERVYLVQPSRSRGGTKHVLQLCKRTHTHYEILEP